jgi:hypothetical protein
MLSGADADRVNLDFEIHQRLCISVFALELFDFAGFESLPPPSSQWSLLGVINSLCLPARWLMDRGEL